MTSGAAGVGEWVGLWEEAPQSSLSLPSRASPKGVSSSAGFSSKT